ncbi:MAG: PQQ-dependent sugar dehydrogenase [Acidimicrobiia bacterium]
MPAGPSIERRVGLLIGLFSMIFLGGVVVRALSGDGQAAPTTSTTSVTTTTDGGSSTTGSEGPSTTLDALTGLRLEPVASGMQQPTYAVSPTGSDRIWVVERPGRIRIIEADGSIRPESFLDIQDRVAFDGIEQGMLGFALHPDFPTDGRIFVYYVGNSANRRLVEFAATEDAADPDSERVLIDLEQPPRSTDIRHYGGMLEFGPDGYLWISSGDGANASDQGQNPEGFFGKILRIDIDSGDPYEIPSDNPFADGGGGPEVWAYGLRNPWRFGIDSVGGYIYIGDVGFGAREEINVLSLDTGGGSNLGWANVEGTICFQEDPCDPTDYVVPALEYDNPGGGCAVTGGHVYRGTAIPELAGTYFYADWCQGFVRSFKWVNGEATEQLDHTEELGSPGQVNAFGLDGAGEILVVTHNGDITRLVANR